MFKVGDIVKGKPGSGTNEFILQADVIDIDEANNMIEVMIIKHEMDEDEVGEEEWVDADDFTLDGILEKASPFHQGAIKSTPVVMTSSDVETALILGII